MCILTCDSFKHRKDIFHVMIYYVVIECSMIFNTAGACAHRGIIWNNELYDSTKKSLNVHNLWMQCNRTKTGIGNFEHIQTKCAYNKVIKHV